jgi:hypothetical protein
VAPRREPRHLRDLAAARQRTLSVAHSDAAADRYLAAFAQLLDELAGG